MIFIAPSVNHAYKKKNKGTYCYLHVEVMWVEIAAKRGAGNSWEGQQNDRMTYLQTQFLLPLVLVNIKYV